jgi:hypothetical protein
MPLVGGGSAGNVGGSNPAGTGTSLNYIGNHVYGYSGNFVSSGTDDTTYLEFDVALNQYIVGRFEFMYDESANIDINFDVNFNDESIASFIIGNAGSAGTGLQPAVVNVIIPGGTKVKATCKGSNSNFTVGFTGRVYQ